MTTTIKIERYKTRRGVIVIRPGATDSSVARWTAVDLGGREVASGVAGSRSFAVTDGYVALVRAGTPTF